MANQPDSFKASLIWGRIGAAVLCMVAFVLQTFGIDFSPGDQAGANETITGIIAGIAGLMALVSKLREKKGVGNTGKIDMVAVAGVSVIAATIAISFILLNGCASLDGKRAYLAADKEYTQTLERYNQHYAVADPVTRASWKENIDPFFVKGNDALIIWKMALADPSSQEDPAAAEERYMRIKSEIFRILTKYHILE